jgi:hypothetical protein
MEVHHTAGVIVAGPPGVLGEVFGSRLLLSLFESQMVDRERIVCSRALTLFVVSKSTNGEAAHLPTRTNSESLGNIGES